MSNRNYIHVPKAFQLILYTDANSYGHYYLQGNPGEQPVGYNAIDRSTTVVIKPTNESRNFAVISEAGNISYEVDLHYVEEIGENELRDLDDVQIVDILENDIIKWDGVNWVNAFNSGGGGASELDELSDVEIGSLVDKQSLMYNSGLDVWQNRLLVKADISDFGTYLENINNESIDDLADVNIVAPSNGQVLKYNAGVWSNHTDSGVSAAEDVTFDNTTSGLVATDVQSAIDELDSSIDSLDDVAFSGDYSDLSNLPSIPSQYTDELAQDAVGTICTDSTFINLDYNDGTPSIIAALSATGTPDSTTFLRGDNTWATLVGGSTTFPAIAGISTSWYASPGVLNVSSGSKLDLAHSTGNIYYKPYFITKTTTFTDIGIATSATATGNVNLAIYNDGGNMKPTGNPIANSTSGSIAASATAFLTYTFSSAITLTPGIYWVAYTTSGTCNFYAPNTNTTKAAYMGSGTISPAATSIDTELQVGWSESFTYNTTMPTVGGSLTRFRHNLAGSAWVFLKAQ